MITNIFILPESGEKLHTGEPARGHTLKALGGFVLYPPAFEQKKHPAGGNVPRLTGIATHEYFHQYNTHGGVTKLQDDWNKLAGWRLNFKYPELVGGKPMIADLAPLVETEYGLGHAAEEFCDAGVKAIYNKENFKDRNKLNFFTRQNLVNYSGTLSVEPTTTLPVRQPKIPELPKEFTFTLVRLVDEKRS